MTEEKSEHRIETTVIGDGACLIPLVTVLVISVLAVGIAWILGGFSG